MIYSIVLINKLTINRLSNSFVLYFTTDQHTKQYVYGLIHTPKLRTVNGFIELMDTVIHFEKPVSISFSSEMGWLLLDPSSQDLKDLKAWEESEARKIVQNLEKLLEK